MKTPPQPRRHGVGGSRATTRPTDSTASAAGTPSAAGAPSVSGPPSAAGTPSASGSRSGSGNAAASRGPLVRTPRRGPEREATPHETRRSHASAREASRGTDGSSLVPGATSPGEPTAKESTGRLVQQRPGVSQAMRALRHPTGQKDAVEVLGGQQAQPGEASVQRIDELLRARRHGRLRVLGIALGAAAGAAVMIWVVFFSALFALDAERITVTGGDERFSNEQAREVLLSYVGTPLTRLSTGAVRDELTAATPVKEAVVERQWPAGISVALTMRTPTLVEKIDGAYQLLDDEAVILGQTPEPTPGLPLVTLPQDEAQRSAAVEDLKTVQGVLPDALRSQVSQWRFDSHLIFFTLADGREVRWGTREDSELKGQVLTLLVGQRTAKTYDVSSPASPVTSER